MRPISPDDPIVLRHADRALEPYRDLLPPEVLDEMRRLLILGMISHPYAQDLIRQLQPPPVVNESGIVPSEVAALGNGIGDGDGYANGNGNGAGWDSDGVRAASAAIGRRRA